MEKILLTVEEAAEVLGLSRGKVFQLIKEGSLPSFKLGKTRRVPAGMLQEWVQEQTSRIAKA